MPSTNHLALLNQGTETWNTWKAQNPQEKIDFSDVDLSGLNCRNVNFENADLTEANLSGANLNFSELSFANFSNATLIDADLSFANLSGANLSGANLSGADLSFAKLDGVNLKNANLFEAKLVEADLPNSNLANADLGSVNLTDANLSHTNIDSASLYSAIAIGANFSNANLSNVALIRTQALGANFTNASLTGVCLEDWNINSATKLDGVVCTYVYLKSEWLSEISSYSFYERRPSSRDYSLGEFSSLFRKALETVDLIFSDGINWHACEQAFKELQDTHGKQNLFVQAIEYKGNGVFLIRLQVPLDADKAAIEHQAKEKYESICIVEENLIKEPNKDKYQIEMWKKEAEIRREHKEDLMSVISKIATSKQSPITIETKAVSQNKPEGDRNINFSGSIRGAGYVEGNNRYYEQLPIQPESNEDNTSATDNRAGHNSMEKGSVENNLPTTHSSSQKSWFRRFLDAGQDTNFIIVIIFSLVTLFLALAPIFSSYLPGFSDSIPSEDETNEKRAL